MHNINNSRFTMAEMYCVIYFDNNHNYVLLMSSLVFRVNRYTLNYLYKIIFSDVSLGHDICCYVLQLLSTRFSC